MKASLLLDSAIEKSLVIVALLSTLFLAYPETTVLASGPQNTGATAQIFEVSSNSKLNLNIHSSEVILGAANQASLAQGSLTIDQIITTKDILAPELDNYLASKGSPLAGSANSILAANNTRWKRSLAISFVESNMCIHTPKRVIRNGRHRTVVETHNCSGIAGGKKVYASYTDWFTDMNNLMNQPNYADRPIEKFLHYYVQPGSKRWLAGVKKTEADLTAMEQQADNQRLAMLNSAPVITATNGPIELVLK
jgi:hypothetical protein